jgi:hypothetical protein
VASVAGRASPRCNMARSSSSQFGVDLTSTPPSKWKWLLHLVLQSQNQTSFVPDVDRRVTRACSFFV